MPAHIYTSIEIAAPPSAVRQQFLSFSTLPTWHPSAFIKSIYPLSPSETISTLVPNQSKLHVELKSMTMKPTFLENSPSAFRWLGEGLGGTFNGEHIFRFEESKLTPGGTTFVQEEKFSGAMTWMIGEGAVAGMVGFRKTTVEGFESLNGDLKRACEGGS